MPEIEDLAVSRVREVIGYCDRLKAEISVNDKTPVVDGSVLIYKDASRRKDALIGPVAVQVKGSATTSKKSLKHATASRPVDLADLYYFRSNGGGIYFYVLVDLKARKTRIYSVTLNPFKIERLLQGAKQGQQTLNLKFVSFPEEPQKIERWFEFAWQAGKQDVGLGSSPDLFDERTTFTVYSADGIDLSRPATLELSETDFGVIAHTADGLNVHVDMDLRIWPGSYVEHDTEIAIRAGDVTFEAVRARQISDSSVEVILGPTLRLTIDQAKKNFFLHIDLKRGGTVGEQLDALDFYIAASNGAPLHIGPFTYTPDGTPPGVSDDLTHRRARTAKIRALFRELRIDESLVQLPAIDDEQHHSLMLMHAAIVEKEELFAADGAAGRFDISIGPARATVMAVPGAEDHRWRFFDIFDPANRNKFVLYERRSNEEVVRITGTAYEGLGPDELATTLNMRLDGITSAYESLGDRPTALRLANPKVLHLLLAADAPQSVQREDLLEAAFELNEWLIRAEGEKTVHLINRWQVKSRRGGLDAEDRDAVRNVRRRLFHTEDDDAALKDTCCAILLGDAEDIRHSLGALPEASQEAIREWPIWHLAPEMT